MGPHALRTARPAGAGRFKETPAPQGGEKPSKGRFLPRRAWPEAGQVHSKYTGKLLTKKGGKQYGTDTKSDRQ